MRARAPHHRSVGAAAQGYLPTGWTRVDPTPVPHLPNQGGAAFVTLGA
jgi:hypothetical protein